MSHMNRINEWRYENEHTKMKMFAKYANVLIMMMVLVVVVVVVMIIISQITLKTFSTYSLLYNGQVSDINH